MAFLNKKSKNAIASAMEHENLGKIIHPRYAFIATYLGYKNTVNIF